VIPAPLTTLIGREEELEAVAVALAGTRLLTLTGAGGVGKTRLAAAVAPAGAHWVALASRDDVLPALVRALDVQAPPGLGELEALTALLAGERALLVLDNCEHVVEEAAQVVAALLGGCPGLTVLATSRVPLGIVGETRWEVPPLAAAAASELFHDRAGRVSRGWRGDDERAVAEICRKLEGVPLALELAASRVAVLSPAAIARGLDDALDLLTGRRSLRASLDWSYGLLDAEARRALSALAVFRGGAALEHALELCSLAALETLAEHSLVRVEHDRLRILEIVRRYALERLETDARDRHLDLFLALAERTREDVLSPRQPEAFATLDEEAANLAAAIEHALGADPAKALRLCLALDFWFRARARFREADAAFERAIAAASGALRARALAAWAWIVGSGGDFTRAEALAAEAAEGGDAWAELVLANHRFFTDPAAAVALLEHCRGADEEYIAARAEALLRGAAWFRQDTAACVEGFDALRVRLERLGDRETLAWFWFEQGALRHPLREHEEAATLLRRAVAVAAEVGEPTADRAARGHLALLDLVAGQAQAARAELLAIHDHTLLHGGSFALPWLSLLVGVADAACGDLPAARARLAALVDLDAWGAAHALAWATAELAEVQRLLGDPAAAATAERALQRARALGNPWLEAKAQLAGRDLHAALGAIAEHGLRLELPAVLEAFAGHTGDARLLGAADRARRELGLVAWPAQREEVTRLRERLGADPEAYAQGAALEDPVAWLRRGRGPRDRPARGWASLTPTEREVARHAAAGLTNPEIAARLFVSRATVKTHLSHVYAKLQLANRAQLAAQYRPPG
jgi:predicted ATPase/DNA-binding CsgD family transcriptional regulator